MKTGKPSNDRRILGELAISMELCEALEKPIDIIKRMGTLPVSGKANTIKGRQGGLTTSSVVRGRFLLSHSVLHYPAAVIRSLTIERIY
jgi:hypothetical protein